MILVLIAVWALYSSTDVARSQVLKTQKVALQETFAGCDTVIRKTVFLTDAQVEQIETAAKTKLESKIVTYYAGGACDSTRGFAFFETNVVRTRPETFMVVLNSDASVNRVEMLAFYEPFDYLPTPKWLSLFQNQRLDDNLWPKKNIDSISGATLTVYAITRGVRKSIAAYQMAIAGKEERQ